MADVAFLTGITGFSAKGIALDLLNAGHRVTGSLRDPARADEVRAALSPRLDDRAAPGLYSPGPLSVASGMPPMRPTLAAIALALPAACVADETISGYADRQAVYILEDIAGQPFPAQATIAFPEPGRIAGTAPCNAWSASQSAPYPWFEPGPVAATRRACPDLPAETRFFQALARVTVAEVQGGVLILSDDTGFEMTFRIQP